MNLAAGSGSNPSSLDSRVDAKDDFFDVPADESSVIRFYSRSFSMASRCLPKEVRGDVEKLYAWCRWCDEAVDSAPSSEVAQSRLSYLREDVKRIFGGLPVKHPASNWLAELVESKEIREVDALALLSGMEMDLRSWQVRDEEELMRYCYRVAGVVGLMMCRVMGVRDSEAERHAVDLGIAMQLTNIARDVKEDWQIERCYLPESWFNSELHRTAVSSESLATLDFSKAPTNDDVRSSVKRLLTLAEVHYKSGLAGLGYLPSSCRKAICLAAMVYREIGREILRQKSKVMDGRVTLSPIRFAWIACLVSTGGFMQSITLNSYRKKFANKFFVYPLSTVTGDLAMRDAKYLAYLGLSLTSFMASALFVMVAMNPKDPSYSALPFIYAGGSVVIGIVTNLLARRAASQTTPAIVLSTTQASTRTATE